MDTGRPVCQGRPPGAGKWRWPVGWFHWVGSVAKVWGASLLAAMSSIAISLPHRPCMRHTCAALGLPCCGRCELEWCGRWSCRLMRPSCGWRATSAGCRRQALHTTVFDGRYGKASCIKLEHKRWWEGPGPVTAVWLLCPFMPFRIAGAAGGACVQRGHGALQGTCPGAAAVGWRGVLPSGTLAVTQLLAWLPCVFVHGNICCGKRAAAVLDAACCLCQRSYLCNPVSLLHPPAFALLACRLTPTCAL